MLEDKYSMSKKKMALWSLGVILGSSSLSLSKVHADDLAQNSSSVQVAKSNSVDVTSAQCAYYQENQQKDNQAMKKIKAEAQKKAQEEQKQQAQQQQNANNQQQNAQQQNNQSTNVQTNDNQQNSAPASATGDNALKAFDNSVAQTYNQQSQKNSNDNAKVLQQQQQANQQANQDLAKKVQSTIQTKTTVATSSDSIGGNNNSSNNQAPTGSGSVYDQFIQAGGTPDMWKYIVMKESSGNPSARNGRYSGLFQTDKGNGTAGHSVAQQTQWAIQYAKQRYGSIQGAINFHIQNGWW